MSFYLTEDKKSFKALDDETQQEIRSHVDRLSEIIEELKEKENIKISSLDSLLSNINNYYDDEIYLNKLIIGEIAL